VMDRVGDAISLLERAAKMAGVLRTPVVIFIGEAYDRGGRHEDAERLARQALELAVERGERGWHAWSARLLGEIAGRHDPAGAETAERHFREALAIATELAMLPLAAHSHLGLGKLYQRVGKQQAQEHLTIATTMYREMGMSSWLEKAQAEMRRAE
jgi:tetratricopeptide (TPR) repeat protein